MNFGANSDHMANDALNTSAKSTETLAVKKKYRKGNSTTPIWYNRLVIEFRSRLELGDAKNKEAIVN